MPQVPISSFLPFKFLENEPKQSLPSSPLTLPHHFKVFALAVIPKIKAGTASIMANILRAVILLQYFPRVRRCYSLISGSQNTGFLFESAWASFTLNLIMYIMSSHVVGALWYMGSTQVGTKTFSLSASAVPIVCLHCVFLSCRGTMLVDC